MEQFTGINYVVPTVSKRIDVHIQIRLLLQLLRNLEFQQSIRLEDRVQNLDYRSMIVLKIEILNPKGLYQELLE